MEIPVGRSKKSKSISLLTDALSQLSLLTVLLGVWNFSVCPGGGQGVE